MDATLDQLMTFNVQAKVALQNAAEQLGKMDEIRKTLIKLCEENKIEVPEECRPNPSSSAAG